MTIDEICERWQPGPWPEAPGIECRPGKQGGAPCVAGTRITVNIFGWWVTADGGLTLPDEDAVVEQVPRYYPDLAVEQVRQGLAYYRANLARFAWEARDSEEQLAQAREDVAALLARVDALEAALGDIAGHQPYPEDIWTPLTTAEKEAIRAAIRGSGVRHPLDRTYAQWGRHVLRQTAEMARAALAGAGEAGR